MNTKPHSKEFSSLPLSPALIQVVQELGFKEMTPIQAESIPLLLEGKDLIGQSRTGSGKTAAFTLPILEKLTLRPRQLQALVLCPTRELSAQVAREIRKLGRRHPGLQVLTLSGGEPIGSQLHALQRGVHIVVGTPGRVLDHLNRRTLDLRRISFLVLDEADRMLDMGFQDDMEKILQDVPENRHTVLFSATYPKSIEQLSLAYQKSPVRVTIQEEKQSVAPIQQQFYEFPGSGKVDGLLSILQQNRPESSIVFCNFKATVAELAQALARAGVSVGSLHGNLEQSDRDRIMAKFRNRSIRVLVATDVAARGIDVENLDAVFNFHLPLKAETYVHRIGRTGRAGKKGLAISLIESHERRKIAAIERYTGTPIEEKTLVKVETSESEPSQKTIQQEASMATLFIGGGRKEKVRPGDILGALTGDAGRLPASDVGKIEIHDHFSYVAVSKGVRLDALQRLRDGKIKGRKFRIELVR